MTNIQLQLKIKMNATDEFTDSSSHSGDMQARQEVVGSLISHIGSGQSKETDTAVKTLSQIKDATDKTLDKFSPLLNGLLDYLNTLSIPQARQVFYKIEF